MNATLGTDHGEVHDRPIGRCADAEPPRRMGRWRQRRLTAIIGAVLAALVLIAPAAATPAHAIEVEQTNPTSRAKVDPNLTNITVFLNKRESRAVVAYGPAAVGPLIAIPWAAAAVAVISVYFANQVYAGKCLKIVKPFVGPARLQLYTGGHCR